MRMKTINSITMVLALTACGTGGSNGEPTADAPTTHDAPNVVHDAPSASGPVTVFTIVLENHDYAEIIGSPNAPYINSLLAQGALATNYKDTNHPSLPNYLHMISGADQYPGFIDVAPNTWPYFPAMQPNLGTQLETAGIKWRSYQESMGTACNMTDAGSYATKHDPFLYFTDMQAQAMCADKNVDYTNFAADLASKQYRYMWITPNLTSDGHDPSTDPVMGMQTSDHWLSVEVPKILASDAYNEGGIIFITWDEAEARNGDDPDKIPMIIVSKKVKTPGMTSATGYDHGAYLATVEDLLALPRLATVTATPNLMEFLTH
jgi:hypothetical protein